MFNLELFQILTDPSPGLSSAVRMRQESTNKQVHIALDERLAVGGFRFTPQRQHVYAVLLETRDHPTAEERLYSGQTSDA